MTARAFSSPEGRRAIGEAVAAAELATSAEVVVAIRRHAGSYFATSAVAGLVLALCALAYAWLSPRLYDVRLMPLEMLAAGLLGGFLVQSIDPLRRVLTPGSVRAAAIARAAEAAFAALGVERTRGRNGLLVYVALMEGTVHLRPDEGIDSVALGAPGERVERALGDAVARRDVDAFCAAVRELGTLLAAPHPRTEADENELCDVHHE